MESMAKRPLVNTDIVRGNAGGNIVASISNGFALAIPTSTALSVTCVNCTAQRVGLTGQGGRNSLGVALDRSARRLGRIMMATVNVGGSAGHINCTVDAVDTSRLMGTKTPGFTSTVCNGTPKIHVARARNNSTKTISVGMHKLASVAKGGRPLVVLSNMPVHGNNANGDASFTRFNGSKRVHSGNLMSVGPRSVRDLDVLGKTSTATLCNSRTTGNTMIVADGHTGDNGLAISFGTRIVTGLPTCLPGMRAMCKPKACGATCDSCRGRAKNFCREALGKRDCGDLHSAALSFNPGCSNDRMLC